MMQAMPYNLQQVKGVVDENSFYKFQQVDDLQELQDKFQLFSDNNDNNNDNNNNSIITITKSSKNNTNKNSTTTSSRTSCSIESTLEASSSSNLAFGSDLNHLIQTGSDSLGISDLDTLFPIGDGSLLPWIMGDTADPGSGFKHLLQSGHPVNVGGFVGRERVHDVVEGRMFDSGFGNNSFVGFGGDLRANPFVDPTQLGCNRSQELQISQCQGVKEQLYKAADSIQTGDISLAQEILARLNHQLSNTTKPPLVRAALYVMEALQTLLQLSNNAVVVEVSLPKTLGTYDIVLKMNAYKAFSEVSPITHFVNFTCTQAILEAIDDSDAVHIVDFDIGCGAQWASLIQELPLRKRGAPSLQITAFAPSSTHPFELALVRDNLVQFANDSGVTFEFQVISLDSFDPSLSSFPNVRTTENECVAVSIPIWSSSHRPSNFPSILQFINQCSPKIVLSWDQGFNRCDVPFPQHLIHSLESSTNFMESLDSLNVASNTVNKIEKFLLQPRIENTVLGRLHAPDKMPHWRNLFASAGLTPVHFSNFTETQADYVVKRSPGQGFRVEKRQTSLVLTWQRRDLVEVLAWRC